MLIVNKASPAQTLRGLCVHKQRAPGDGAGQTALGQPLALGWGLRDAKHMHTVTLVTHSGAGGASQGFDCNGACRWGKRATAPHARFSGRVPAPARSPEPPPHISPTAFSSIALRYPVGVGERFAHDSVPYDH